MSGERLNGEGREELGRKRGKGRKAPDPDASGGGSRSEAKIPPRREAGEEKAERHPPSRSVAEAMAQETKALADEEGRRKIVSGEKIWGRKEEKAEKAPDPDASGREAESRSINHFITKSLN